MPLGKKVLGKTSVPVLCYHNIGGNGVPRELFTEQMHWLKKKGIKTLTQLEMRRFLEGEPLGCPSVMLTFDDGFRDLYTFVRPLFRELGFSATVFVINNRIRPQNEQGTEGEIIADEAHRSFVTSRNRNAWLSERELKVLLEESVVELGAHSGTHAMAPIGKPCLNEIPTHWAYAGMHEPLVPELAPELAQPLWSEELQRHESDAEYYTRVLSNLKNSRNELEEQFGQTVNAFAWPWGKDSAIAQLAALDAGFELLFTLKRGPVSPGTDPGAIGRLEVRRKKGMRWFKSRVFLYSHRTSAQLYSAARM